MTVPSHSQPPRKVQREATDNDVPLCMLAFLHHLNAPSSPIRPTMSNDKSSTIANNHKKEGDIQPIFQDVNDNDDDDDDDKHDQQHPEKPAIVSFADGFRDQVRHLFEHFDQDHDGYLNFPELQALQAATTGTTTTDDGSSTLTENMYVMACKALNCHPTTGLSLEALKFTYASDGADISKDFEAVFHADGTPKQRSSTTSKQTTKQTTNDDHENANNEKIYEVGADGTIDISS